MSTFIVARSWLDLTAYTAPLFAVKKEEEFYKLKGQVSRKCNVHS